MGKAKVAEVEVVEAVESPATTLTPAQLAIELGTDPKTCRRFLRSIVGEDARPGKGARWAISADLVPDLKARFEARGTNKVVTELSDAETDADEVDELEDIDTL